MADLGKYISQPKTFKYRLESDLCYTCARAQNGFGKTIMDGPFTKGIRQYCSIKCRESNMDWQPREKEAMKAGIQQFGEYIESLNRPELIAAFMHMSAAELVTAMECYTSAYHEFFATKKIICDEIPLDFTRKT